MTRDEDVWPGAEAPPSIGGTSDYIEGRRERTRGQIPAPDSDLSIADAVTPDGSVFQRTHEAGGPEDDDLDTRIAEQDTAPMARTAEGTRAEFPHEGNIDREEELGSDLDDSAP